MIFRKEVERKFLINKIPDLEGLKLLPYERHFLFRGNKVEIRIQKKGEKYEFERKKKEGSLIADKQKFEITKEEFDKLRKLSKGTIIRDSYELRDDPKTTIKIYHDKFEGLKRVEVEFDSEEEAMNFKPYDWFGEEVTESPLGNDSKLLSLTDQEIKEFIKR